MGVCPDSAGQIPELDSQLAAQLASLVAIGCKSGDTVVGLSAVRRTRGLAYVLVDAGLAEGTVRELARLQKWGTRLFRVASLSDVTRAFGREEVRVIGVKRGSLAQGIAGRLGSESS